MSDVLLPARFADALAEVRAAIARCDEAGVPGDTVLAAFTTELIPRLVETYGANGVASLLVHLAREVSASGRHPSQVDRTI